MSSRDEPFLGQVLLCAADLLQCCKSPRADDECYDQWPHHGTWLLDEPAMAVAARQFEGQHDFSSFAASSGSEEDDRDRNMVREIHSSEIIHSPQGEEIAYVVRGRSFLRYMVRKIVGTLLEVGKGKLASDDIPQLFDVRDRTRSGPTVPPEGLYLVSLEYPDPTDSLASVSRRRPSHVEPKVGSGSL